MPDATSFPGWKISLITATVLVHGAATSFARPPVRWDALNDVGNLGRVEAVEVSPFDSRTIVAGGDVLGAGVTHDGGATWEPTLGFLNYQDNDITFDPADPNTIWIGTLGGPYKSTDGGRHWTLKREGMPPAGTVTITAPIERVIFDPNDSSTLLAVAGNHRHMGYGKVGITRWGGVWKSTDGGEHWKQIVTIDDAAVGSPDDGTGVMINDMGFAASSSSVVYACSDEFGVYKSTDRGVTWGKINQGLPNTKTWSIALHPTDPNILCVAMGGGAGIYKSTDGGSTWHKSCDGMSDLTSSTVYRTIAVARSNPDYLYCAAWEGSGSTYRSTDGGSTWTRLVARGSHRSIVGGTGNSGGLFFQRISVDPRDPKHVVGACEGMVVQSWDAGETWKDTTSVATNGGWRGTGYCGMCGTCIAWNPYKPGQAFTLGDDEGKLERSEDYLWSWRLKGSPGLIGPYNGAADASFAADGTIYVGSGQFGNHYGAYANEPIIKSTDFGANWFYVKRPVGAVGDNRAVYVNPRDSRQVWCITGGAATGTLWKSNDGGNTWATLELGDAGGLWNIAADPKEPTTMYIGARNGIYRSADGTHFLRMQGSPTSRNYEYAYLDPTDSRIVYAVSFNSGSLGGLYRYNGSGWTRLLAKPQARAVAVDPANSRRFALLTRGWAAFDQTSGDGVWISEDTGANWQQCNDGLRMLGGVAIAFNPDRSSQLILATDGAGFFATDLGDSTPHGGKPRSVIGTVAAMNYDDGLQGFDTSKDNRADALRGLKSGQWAKFQVNVPSAGHYDVICTVASTTGGKFHLEFNGVNVTGPVEVKATPDAWTDVRIPHVALIPGDQYMKLFAETDSIDIKSIQMCKE
ncbi:MAG TPA: carbohydrate-binding protein [Tepidisphaeraceae bacterium]|nr:carbohydrate-binding protein [Tepidisphaeraceae bacterium]